MTKYKTVVLSEIILPEDRQREDYGDIEDLANSIEELGLLQPLGVEEGSNKLVWGGRRYKALMHLGQDKADCRIVPKGLTGLELEAIELEENIRRKALTPAEECKAYKRIDSLKKQLLGDAEKDRIRSGWSKRKTAALLGEAPSGVAEKIMLAEAMEIMPELANCKTIDEMKKTFKSAVEDAVVKDIVNSDEGSKGSIFKFAEHHYKIGDFFEEAAKMQKTRASFAIVDPPYGINLDKTKKVDVATQNLDRYTEWPKDSYIDKIAIVAAELYRLLDDNAWVVWWFGIEWYQPLMEKLIEVGFEVDNIPGIWFKSTFSGQSKQPSINLGRAYETFFVCRKGSPALAKRGRGNVFMQKTVSSQKKIHTTEKPFELMKEIFEVFAFPGTVFIVPFLGSGVDLRVGYSLGLSGFGWDLSQEHKDKFLYQVLKDTEGGVYEHARDKSS